MCEKGLGEWYGIFIKNQMVADMAVFFVDCVGNFQDVETIPEYRKQGICGSAVYKIAKHLFQSKRVHTMMMIADENYHAARIYESVGFKPSEKSVCLLNSQYFLRK